MSEVRRKYTREFKLEAVRLSEDPDQTAADVARGLDTLVMVITMSHREPKPTQ